MPQQPTIKTPTDQKPTKPNPRTKSQPKTHQEKMEENTRNQWHARKTQVGEQPEDPKRGENPEEQTLDLLGLGGPEGGGEA